MRWLFLVITRHRCLSANQTRQHAPYAGCDARSRQDFERERPAAIKPASCDSYLVRGQDASIRGSKHVCCACSASDQNLSLTRGPRATFSSPPANIRAGPDSPARHAGSEFVFSFFALHSSVFIALLGFLLLEGEPGSGFSLPSAFAERSRVGRRRRSLRR